MMGTFYATIQVGNLDGGGMAEVSAMVDTGAGYSMLPESLLQQLHIQPREQRRFSSPTAGMWYTDWGPPASAFKAGNGLARSSSAPKTNISWVPPLWKSSA